MKDIFSLSKLLIKKKLKVLNESEKQNLKQLHKKNLFSKDINYDKIIHKIEYYDTLNNDKAWEAVTKKQKLIHRKIRIPVYSKNLLKYAAIFVGIIGIGVYLYQLEGDTIAPSSSESITLQLENGDIEIITDTGEQKVITAKGQLIGVQKGGQLQYHNNNNNNNNKELVYNELSVPYGKRFELILSDGTQVYLNSGTSIKYPVTFLQGKDRNVFLKGEAYFDVAKDTIHPFIVNTDVIDVQVLGTKFNVSSYPEDNYTNTILVEGSVSLHQKLNTEASSLLYPGHKATWDKTEERISIKKVDTSIYTGWIEGKLIFKDAPFNEILKKLERHYNVTIKNYNKELNYERFDAVFDIETIEDVLNSFNENHPVKFSINDNQIMIY